MQIDPLRLRPLISIGMVALFGLACGSGGTTPGNAGQGGSGQGGSGQGGSGLGGSGQGGSGQGGSGACPAGTLGCACYGNSTCNAGLDCSGGVCRAGASGSGGSSGGAVGAGGSGAAGGSGTGGTGTGTGGTSGADAPVIISLATNITTMKPTDSLVVTAIVTDPQGIADVIGGALNDPSGASYGAFQVSTTSGSYSLTLSWDALETVQDITTAPPGTSRTFVAVLYDQEGHSTSKSFSIQLQCADATNAICGGNCIDPQTDPRHCGVCAHSCYGLYDGSASCSAGKCRDFVSTPTGIKESCDTACTSAFGGGKLVCGGSSAAFYGSPSYCGGSIACSMVPTATCTSGTTMYGYTWTDCFCQEP